MTDASRPGDDQLDELASAYLDGELDTAERERVEHDPALSDRVAELAAMRAQVAAPVAPLAADRREAMIRSAVEALDAGAIAPVVSLSSRRTGRRILRVLAPVAAAAAAIGAIAFIARDGDGESSDPVAFEASADTPAAGAEGADRATEGAAVETTAAAARAEEAVTNAADEAGTAPAPGAATFSALPDLGAASSPSEVAALLRNSLTAPEESTATTASGGGEQDSTSLRAACANAGTPVATLVYAGEQAIVVAVGEGRYAVLGTSCAVRAEFTSET
jgi:hypothetical protein